MRKECIDYCCQLHLRLDQCAFCESLLSEEEEYCVLLNSQTLKGTNLNHFKSLSILLFFFFPKKINLVILRSKRVLFIDFEFRWRLMEFQC